jgi:hypothetical protein
LQGKKFDLSFFFPKGKTEISIVEGSYGGISRVGRDESEESIRG